MTNVASSKASAKVRPALVIGWMIAADVRDAQLLDTYAHAKERLYEYLSGQFPAFSWCLETTARRNFSPRGALDALELLEAGASEKLRRRWDYALVIVPNELEARQRIAPLGVPSSALEVAVLSSAYLGDGERLSERIAALAQHVLGHLFTLEKRSHGPMGTPTPETRQLARFPPEQEKIIEDVLQDVADARLEEMSRRWTLPGFYLRSFLSDPWNILKRIWGYRPWRFPLYLGRLTAAVVASLLFLLLTAESWEAGAHMRILWLCVGTVLAIGLASTFIFLGQNLNQVGRGHGWSEQLARSRLVIFGTLLSDMIFLWAIMFLSLYALSLTLLVDVVAGWARFEAGELPRLRYVGFMAVVGMLAAALGRNLEDEDTIKAQFFFDEAV